MEKRGLSFYELMAAFVILFFAIAAACLLKWGWEVALVPAGLAIILIFITLAFIVRTEEGGCCLIIIALMIFSALVAFAIAYDVLKIIRG